MSDPQTGTMVLASGGVESGVLLHRVADGGGRVLPVYVRQGFRWERVETLWLARFLEASHRSEFLPLEVLVLPLADLYAEDHFSIRGPVPTAGTPDEACNLPGRNVTVLGKAGVLASARGLGAIALGSLGGNPFPDATPGFFGRMSAVLSEGLGCPLEITAPLLPLRKAEVIEEGAKLPLHLTFSCMSPVGEFHCGTCAKCGERRRAFRDAGIADPTEYSQ